jgi:hypothetical protein
MGAVVNRIRAAKQRLASLGVKNIGLFGSFAKGRQTPTSDVDVLVEFMPDHHTFDNFIEVSFFSRGDSRTQGRGGDPGVFESHFGPHILRELVRIDVAA